MTLIRFKYRWWHFAIYLAPISVEGLIDGWRSKMYQWRSGYVLRFLWLGIVYNWGIPR